MKPAVNLALSSALLVSASHAAAEDKLRRLEPNSPWVMDYAEDSCALRRTFGSNDDVVLLELRQFSPSAKVQVTVAGSQIKSAMKNPRTMFMPDDQTQEIKGALYGQFGEMTGIVIQDSFRTNALEEAAREREREEHIEQDWPEEERKIREAAINGYFLGEAFNQDLELLTGSLADPMNAMQACLDELLTHWGIDAEAHRSLSRNAKPRNFQGWERKLILNYPVSMIRQGKSGLVRVRLSISPSGEPSDCHAQMEVAEQDFEKDACRLLMKYAEFDPALDKEGKPIASYWTTSVSYLLN